MGKHKVLFGYVEAVFDLLYLCAAAAVGIFLLVGAQSAPQCLAGTAAAVLAGGDAFHLLPRIAVICTGQQARYRRALGLGKLVTSLTMTAFYLLLWHLGLLICTPPPAFGWTAAVWLLAAVRVVLCLLPQNRWLQGTPPPRWGVWRNLPFILLGGIVLVFFAQVGGAVPALLWMWLAIALSFLFYLPVVLWADRNPKLGMLMLPKTCAYLWMLSMLVHI